MHRDAATHRIGRAAQVGPRGTTLAAALAAAMLAGCTMCPDPFDYSGPVPNGNVAQNDFRARSKGIRPLGGQPPTWPQIVGASPRPANDSPVPTLAGPGRGASAVEPASATIDDPIMADRIPRDAVLPRGIRLAAVDVGDAEEAGGQPTSTMPGSGHQPSGTTASFGTTATPSRTR
jgi:hypothetical protein